MSRRIDRISMIECVQPNIFVWFHFFYLICFVCLAIPPLGLLVVLRSAISCYPVLGRINALVFNEDPEILDVLLVRKHSQRQRWKLVNQIKAMNKVYKLSVKLTVTVQKLSMETQPSRWPGDIYLGIAYACILIKAYCRFEMWNDQVEIPS